MATNPILAALMRPPLPEQSARMPTQSHPDFFGAPATSEFWNAHGPHGFDGQGIPPKRTPAALASNPAMVSPTLTFLQQPVPMGTTNAAEIVNVATGRPRRPVLPVDDPREVANRDRFGLSGVVQQSSSNTGFDLTFLGLNLNAPNHICRSLVSPWNVDEVSQSKVARSEYSVPMSFLLKNQEGGSSMNMTEFRPKPEQIASLPPEALFYCFYYMPQDAMQGAAAKELTSRGWRFHKVAKAWMTTSPAGSSDWVLFDAKDWTTKPSSIHKTDDPTLFL